MATRSTIAIEKQDGTIEKIYCHWDGYPENNGIILKEHYSDPCKLQKLIDFGNLSILKKDIGIKHNSRPLKNESQDEYDKKYSDMCIFYSRDMGDSGREKSCFVNFEEYRDLSQKQEFNYILRSNGEWQYHSENKIIFEKLDINIKN